MIFETQIVHAAIDTNKVVATTITPIVIHIINPILVLIMTASIVIFIWGVAGLIMNADDAEKRKESQNHILWGIVGLFIIISVFGIIRFIASTLDVKGVPFI